MDLLLVRRVNGRNGKAKKGWRKGHVRVVVWVSPNSRRCTCMRMCVNEPKLVRVSMWLQVCGHTLSCLSHFSMSSVRFCSTTGRHSSRASYLFRRSVSNSSEKYCSEAGCCPGWVGACCSRWIVCGVRRIPRGAVAAVLAASAYWPCAPRERIER